MSDPAPHQADATGKPDFKRSKHIEWSYPTSDNAERFGYKSTGCWTVSRGFHHPEVSRPSEAVRGFAEREAAVEFARTEMTEPWSRLHVRMHGGDVDPLPCLPPRPLRELTRAEYQAFANCEAFWDLFPTATGDITRDLAVPEATRRRMLPLPAAPVLGLGHHSHARG